MSTAYGLYIIVVCGLTGYVGSRFFSLPVTMLMIAVFLYITFNGPV